MSKHDKLQKITNENGIINALAIDQRGALKRMLGEEASESEMARFKTLVSRELTNDASAILLDPEYGWQAADARHEDAGLLMAYEKTGYDKEVPGRLPDLLDEWSVYRLKEQGADAIKILLYYDVDEEEAINIQKKAFIERVGSECAAVDLPYFLEILTYDSELSDTKGKAFAELKPHKVIESMKEFSAERYQVDVLKIEVPVNMAFVEGYGDEVVYTKEQAAQYFKEQSDATNLPFIFLSAGVSAELFRETLVFAAKAGSKYNGVLCGRATWKGAASAFLEGGEEQALRWLKHEGRENIQDLNETLQDNATPMKGLFS
ncbi:tagatose-bisphosphate aldolase [Natribacillus halophilus]|uniref:Tagatose 1,6-diphosphate aldolase n=1 Tax=Natribacillus halophilus TaxID=549003 RepID=A0A1G8N4B9_9BACI|nr:tagatose-bisphosphate aldolase [Natribacillus halophilus]SDI74410.1 tagatose 1,6-diphosphate aldolase [Natribacillus halophilus]